MPILVSEPGPLPPYGPPSCSTPENAALRLLLPTVRLLAPRKTTPLPSIEPIAMPGALWELMSSLPYSYVLYPLPSPKTSTRAVPPLESPPNKMMPPPPEGPSLAMSTLLPAVEVSLKPVEPPQKGEYVQLSLE